MEAVADTPYGRLAGDEIDGVRRFLGIPYAAPPVGELRLRSPRPPHGWKGVLPARRIGPAAPQKLAGAQTWLNDPIERQDENCLFLNVWAPSGSTGCPVLVWFHGGATRNGHGGAAAMDGELLARRHGIMVVTVNYRLGPLGGLAHPELADAETGFCANWGLQDKIAALNWVQAAATAFGGDAANVTIGGQSSGAANVVFIAQNPDFQHLFARAIAQSPPLFQAPMLADLEGAAEYTEALAGWLGADVGDLRDIDGSTLVARELEFLRDTPFGRRFGRPRTAPTLDGALIRAWPYGGSAAAPAVPLVIGFTRDESRFWYDLRRPDGTLLTSLVPPGDGTALLSEVEKLIRLYYPFAHPPAPEAVVDAYAAALAGPADPAALWHAIYTDLVFRAPIVHLATRQSARAPTFLYEFAWPLAPPAEGTPHAADVPFVFGTIGHPHLAAKVGRPSEARTVSDAMSAHWASFIRSGTPLPSWRRWAPGSPDAMIFGAADMEVPGSLSRPTALAAWRAFGVDLR